MAYQAIGVGTTPGDGTGDTIRGGGAKINENFVELYTLLGTGTALTSGISATATVVTLAGPTITGVASFADGSATAPAITNTGDTNTGIYFGAADTVNVTTGGTKRVDIDSSGLDVTGAITATTTITGATLEATGDIVAGDDIKLLSDASVLSFGANSEVTLTHVHNDGLLLNTDMQLQFRDSAINIRSDADGDLDINADDEIELNSTLIDVNGNLDVSGTIVGAGAITGGGLMTTGGNIVIPNAGNIGSAGDTDAIAIASDGVVTFSQAPVFPDGSINIADIDLDGGTDIGAAIVDADLFLIDDGGGGTMRKTAASRLKTYIQASTAATAADDIGAGDDAVLITTDSGNITIDAAANNTDIILKGTDDGADTTFLTIDGSAAGEATFNAGIVIADAGTIGSASDKDAIAIASDGVVTMNQIPVFSAGINVSGGTIAGTLATAAQANITSLGTLTTLTVDNIIINGTNIGHTSDTDAIAIASDGVVTFSQIPVFPDNSVQTGAIADANVTTAKLAAGAVGFSKMAANSIDSDQYVDGSIDTIHIADANITTAKLANDAVTLAKMAGLARGKIIYGDASGNPDALALGSSGTVLTSDGTDISWGNITSLGTLGTLTVDSIIIDGTNIGHTSDTDAIAIASNGVVTFSQAPVFPDGSIAVADLDIDGATDIGAAIVDADLFIIDDGAGGTNRKTTAARLKTYIGAGAADEITAGDAAVNITTSSGNITIDAAANNSDIIFKGTDGGADITMLTLDGSAAGEATFNAAVIATSFVTTSSGTSNFIAGLGSGASIASDGNDNVIIGSNAADAATTADNTIAIGHDAIGTGVLTGTDNTAIGRTAGNDLTTGTYNNFMGYQAGYNATEADNTVAIGTNAIGTGVLTGASNVAIGTNAGYDLTSGETNVFVGYQVAANATEASNTIAIGKNAIGTGVMTGSDNTAIGQLAGNDLTSGTRNVMVGYGAGFNATTADYSIAIGYLAMGTGELAGTDNIGIGRLAGTDLTSGAYNVMVGYQAGTNVETGADNTILGPDAGDALTTGSNNTIIGHDAAASAVDVSNEITLGDTNVTKFRVPGAGFQVTSGALIATGDITAFGSLSDIRLKENIEPITSALDKVSQIGGYTFNYKKNPDVRMTGVIAQEVEKVLPEVIYTTTGINSDEEEHLAVRYENMIGLLVEAIKELKTEVEELKKGK